MGTEQFFHALKILEDVCIGCSHCVRVCPTEALRIRDGKSHLYPDRCVDCGECYRVCPVNAIINNHDDFDKIFKYKYRVALVPSVVLGQFKETVEPEHVFAVLKGLGFTDIVEGEEGAHLLIDLINERVANRRVEHPVISSFCPAVVRLIQVNFPGLTPNIMPIKAPLDLSAIYIREKYRAMGIDDNDVGVFYITPCAAKIVAIVSPVADDKGAINGFINLDFIYNKVMKVIKTTGSVKNITPDRKSNLDATQICWALTGGEARHIKGRSLSIDGMRNVIDFLEKLENEEVENVDYLELRMCDQGCAGGILVAANRFLVVERMHKRAQNVDPNNLSFDINSYAAVVKENAYTDNIRPRTSMRFDVDVSKAIAKMEKVRRLMCFLPGIDCSVCGAPTCQAHAEDVVQGRSSISNCIFLQKMLEKQGLLDSKHAFRIVEKIWGKDRFDKNCTKRGAKNEGKGNS